MKINSLRVALTLVAVSAAAYSVSAQTKLNGAGATFPAPLYQRWIAEFTKANPNVQINYQAVGSGTGITNFTQGIVNFAGSDAAMTDEQIAKVKQGVVLIPATAGSIVLAYNLPGVESLKLSREAYSGIFVGKITKWNDPTIAKANEGVKLPDTAITVCERSDGSGTTFVFTDYLSKISSEWKSRVGSSTSVSWPVGLGAKGNEGVAGMIRQMEGGFGYVELIYALQNKITFGPVQNASGNFVKASLESTTAAAAGAKMVGEDFRVSITNAPGKDAYPIASFTYLLIPKQWKDGTKQKATFGFLDWMLNSGQSMITQLNYAPLPDAVKEKELAVIKAIQ